MILRKYQMTRNRQERIDIDLDDNVLDPEVLVPGRAFNSEDLTPRVSDFCINCETTQKIIGKITIGHSRGSICVKCFKAYQK